MKRSKSQRAFILILSLPMIISSCGGGNSVIKKSFAANISPVKEDSISTNERNIASRICYAFRSKSGSFRSSGFVGTNFTFSGKKTDCQDTVTNYSINSTLRYDQSNNLIYAAPDAFPSNLQFNEFVQTDTAGYLSQLCTKIFTNQPVSNTFSDSGMKVQISFFQENLDGFQLLYFTQVENDFKIDSGERFKIRTQNLAPNILGMDEYYLSQKVCNKLDRKEFSEYEQSFVSR